VKVVSNLIEFEESPGIKTFFELAGSDSSTSSLFIVLDDRVMASLEVIRGTLEDELDLILEASIENEVNSLGGFTSKLDDDFPDDISTKFTVDGQELNQYHMFKFGQHSLTAHLTVLNEWYEEDLARFRAFLDSVFLCEYASSMNSEIGEMLTFDNFEESVGLKVGHRSYLGSQLQTIE
jgi:hypothetical protein